MKAYIGAKVILATPEMKEGTDGAKLDGYKVVYPDGYTSWSPRRTFDTCYRELMPDETKLINEG